MKENLSKGWHVLYVKSRHEKKVYQRLKENGLEAYLPLIETERKWSDRTKKVTLPLFTSYVFVKIKTAMDFYKALCVNGACAYISFGNNYAVIKDEEIEKIKFLIEIDGIKDVKVDQEVLTIGEIKVITNGSLKGFECEVLQIKNKNHVIVRLGALKQNLRAIIPSECLSSFSKAI